MWTRWTPSIVERVEFVNTCNSLLHDLTHILLSYYASCSAWGQDPAFMEDWLVISTRANEFLAARTSYARLRVRIL
jgi:hypothetical protein